MGEQAQILASQFQRANEGLIALAQQLSEELWKVPCVSDGRTVGVVLYHVAEGHAFTCEIIRSIARGAPSPSGLVQHQKEVSDPFLLMPLRLWLTRGNSASSAKGTYLNEAWS